MPNCVALCRKSRATKRCISLVGLISTATRVAEGTISLSSCRIFPPKPPGTIVATPVTLPPGRARLSTSPNRTGSATPTITIGIVEVALLSTRLGCGAERDDQIELQCNQLGGECRQSIRLAGCIAALDDEVVALHVAALAQFLVKRRIRSPLVDDWNRFKHADAKDPLQRLRKARATAWQRRQPR